MKKRTREAGHEPRSATRHPFRARADRSEGLRNRFYQAPHCTSYGSDLPGAQAHLRGMKAEGGWAAVNTEFCSVHPPATRCRWSRAALGRGRRRATLADRRAGARARRAGRGRALARRLRRRQPRIATAGAQRQPDRPTRASTRRAATSSTRPESARSRTTTSRPPSGRAGRVRHHQRRGRGVRRAAQHFLMAKFNRRTDEYGGSIDNRARFWIEILERVREAVGDEARSTARLVRRHAQRQPARDPRGRGGASVHRAGRSVRRLLGPAGRRLGGGGVGGRRRRRLAVRGRVLPSRVHRRRPDGDQEAGRRGRAVHRIPTRWPRRSARA